MASHRKHADSLILGLLREVRVIELDEMAARLPELTLAELFLAVDRLSRTGAIRLSRRGYQYECTAA